MAGMAQEDLGTVKGSLVKAVAVGVLAAVAELEQVETKVALALRYWRQNPA